MKVNGILLLILGLVFIGGIVWFLLVAQPLVESLLIAGLLAYLFDPLVRWVMRRVKLSRPVAANLVYLFLFIFIVATIAILGAVVVERVQLLELEFQDVWAAVNDLLDQPITIWGFSFAFSSGLQSLQQLAGDTLAALPAGSLSMLGDITNNVLWTLLVLVSFYYFLKDGAAIKPWLVSLLPAGYQADGRQLLDEIDTVWGVFLRVQLFIFVVLAFLVLTATILLIWLFRRGWLPLSPVGLILLLVLVYAAIQQVDNLWLRPQLMSRTLKLHPGLIFIGLIAALGLSGVLGAIVVVPLMATGKIVGQTVHRWLLEQAVSRPEPPPDPAPSLVPSEDRQPNGES